MSDMNTPPPDGSTGQDLLERPRSNNLIEGKRWDLKNIGNVTSTLVTESAFGKADWRVEFMVEKNNNVAQMPLDDFMNNVTPRFSWLGAMPELHSDEPGADNGDDVDE